MAQPSDCRRPAISRTPFDAGGALELEEAREVRVRRVEEVAEHVDVAPASTAVISMPLTSRRPCASAASRASASPATVS